MRDDEHADDRANRRGQTQQAEIQAVGGGVQPAESAVQNFLRENGQQRNGAAQQHGKHVQRERAKNDFIREDEPEPGDEVLDGHRFARGNLVFVPDAGDEKKADYRRHRVEGINHPRAVGEPDEDTAHARAEDGGKLERAAVKSNGAGELSAWHEAGHKRRAGRPQKRPRHADDDEQGIDVCLEQRIHRRRQGGDQHEAEAGQAEHERADKNDFFTAEPVGDVAGRQRAKNHRNHQRQADVAERERRAGALVKLPVHRRDDTCMPE